MGRSILLLIIFIMFISCGDQAEDYYDRGLSLAMEGEYKKAILDYTRAIELNTEYADAYYNRGYIWWRIGEIDKAISDFTRTIELRPEDTMSYISRAYRWRIKGEYNNAILDYKRAIELSPEYATAYNNCAWLLATCPVSKYRHGKKAVYYAEKALKLKKSHEILNTLAAAFAETGRFDDAVKTQKKAIAMLNKNSQYLSGFKERLKLYEQRKPYRHP